MTPAELDRAVARATGETIDTIRARGFSLLQEDDIGAWEAATVDWDAHDARRTAVVPQRGGGFRRRSA